MDKYLPSNGVILDVGAGVGRDARYFAEQGLTVVAVEPASEFVRLGRSYTKGSSVQWLQDTLPDLDRVIALQMKFDLVLLSAVWMHVPPSQRDRAFRKLSNLLKPGGVIVITLRHGPNNDSRKMYEVSGAEVELLARKYGLSESETIKSSDTLGRSDVCWETFVVRLPDDGSGSFPTLRHILINDAKSSTYKLALLRSLIRIADGHPGGVLRRENGSVILPLGLVALYWARQYKILLDANIQQSGNSEKGLGFIREDGWGRLDKFSPLDFSIGNYFSGDEANALHATLKHISSTIRKMPVKYTTFPGSKKQIFEAEIKRTPSNVDSIYIDVDSLSTYGEFKLPEIIWELMSLYTCWVEPVVLNEWVQVMQGYKNNQNIPKYALLEHLEWQDAQRTTLLARQRVDQIRKEKPVHCVWSRVPLSIKYDIDHCLPFSRWPNSDLWNLVPTRVSINSNKRDRIPSDARFFEAKNSMIEWWLDAWREEHRRRFFSEARLSLPGLAQTEHDFEEVFEALKLQGIRLVEMQQLRRW